MDLDLVEDIILDEKPLEEDLINLRVTNAPTWDYVALEDLAVQAVQHDEDAELLEVVAPVSKWVLTQAMAGAGALVTGGVLVISEETLADMLCFDSGFEYLDPEDAERFPVNVVGVIFRSMVLVSDRIPRNRLVSLGRTQKIVRIHR